MTASEAGLSDAWKASMGSVTMAESDGLMESEEPDSSCHICLDLTGLHTVGESEGED